MVNARRDSIRGRIETDKASTGPEIHPRALVGKYRHSEKFLVEFLRARDTLDKQGDVVELRRLADERRCLSWEAGWQRDANECAEQLAARHQPGFVPIQQFRNGLLHAHPPLLVGTSGYDLDTRAISVSSFERNALRKGDRLVPR
jgi:hypothetical protein